MQQAPERRKSPWTRYVPIIAVVVVAGIVIAVFAGGGDDGGSSGASGPKPNATTGVVTYGAAKQAGDLDQYTWQEHCDTETGRVAIPLTGAPPCVNVQQPTAGAPVRGVTADTIRIGRYVAKPDLQADFLARQTGTYDSPEAAAQTFENYVDIYGSVFELYGRTVEVVPIEGTGGGADAVAARRDAATAEAKNVFAVVGGPIQAKEFSEELARRKIVCIVCTSAQPEKFYLDNQPYVWPLGPTPDQTATMVTELIEKQLVGKPAQYGGPDVNGKPRTFAMLTYNTPDGQFTSSWDDLERKVKATGADLKARITNYLDIPNLERDGRLVAAKLKASGATTIIFTGDPITPAFFTKEMTKAGYFPEWVMGGTVYADTNVFARSFDQEQWKHAMGIKLTPVGIPKPKQQAYTLHEWWFGTPPPAENAFAVTQGNLNLLFLGLQMAGPNLSPDTFAAGMRSLGPGSSTEEPVITPIVTFGDWGLWPGTTVDIGGLDNAGVIYWDPEATGTDETGAEGKGMYRALENGLRYLTGQWPTKPLPLFEPEGTVTQYPLDDIPPEFVPPVVPVPPDAPAAKG